MKCHFLNTQRNS